MEKRNRLLYLPTSEHQRLEQEARQQLGEAVFWFFVLAFIGLPIYAWTMLTVVKYILILIDGLTR